jgi:hypothetical protein
MIDRMLITSLLLAFQVPTTSPPIGTVGSVELPLDVRVLVLNFDPIIEAKGGKRLSVAAGHRDPRELAKGYMEDISKASGGFIAYRIIEWRDIDAYPVKKDGFRYTDESYWACIERREKWHEPDGLDYDMTLAEFDCARYINEGKIDEVWLFGGPYFGYWESAMAGPGAFFINGGTYPNVPAKRAFAIMGFNYERGVAEMIHDLCHRTESTLARLYGGWKVEVLDSAWAKFAANEKQSGTAAVGTCHYPPNAEKDYDYANERTVMSTSDDYLGYPKLTGTKKPVNRESWGGPDYHRNYMIWWFSRLPKTAGWNDDGRLNNWWRYVFQFTEFDETGKPKRR